MLRSVVRRLATETWKQVEAKLSQPEFIEQADLKIYLKNEEIKVEESVFVKDWREKTLGKTSLVKAQKLANKLGLDAVLICTQPPTIQLMEYSKFLLKQTAKKYVKAYREYNFANIKAFKVKSRITQHDFGIKVVRILRALYKHGGVTVELEEVQNADDLSGVKSLASQLLSVLQDDQRKWQETTFNVQEKAPILRLEISYDRKLSDLIDTAKEGFETPELPSTDIVKKLNKKILKFSKIPPTEEEQTRIESVESILESLEVTTEAKGELLDFLKELEPEDLLDPVISAKYDFLHSQMKAEENLVKEHTEAQKEMAA